MRYLISARHGHYDDCTGDLTSKGLEQIEELANAIKEITDLNSLCITYAGERRVVQTAEALAKKLGISDSRFIDQDISLTKNTYRIREDLAFEAYNSWAENYFAMIFVSHECPALDNATYLAEKISFDKKQIQELNSMLLFEGKAVLLDLEQKIFRAIPTEKSVQKIKEVQTSKNIDLAF